ncbi:hypothetical protein GCM10023191_088960 [Actinoallomurus oryzae]|uniref:Uncharacterized protein n=2 Tax=Actinoallomurus oryzae TaxID=502180 RepID=A0ABP8R3I4_9ACTN
MPRMSVDMDVAKVLAEVQEHCVETLGERDGPRMAALARRGYRIAPAGEDTTPARRPVLP